MSKKIILPTISLIVAILIGAVILFPFQSSGQIEKLEQEAKNSYEQANFEESIAYYKELLELEPTHVNARIGLAKSYIGIARLDLADSTLTQGIELIPTESLFYSHLSELHLLQSDILSALAVLEAGMDNVASSEFKEEYENFLEQIKIDLPRPYIQKGFDRSIHLVWADEKGRMIPLDAEWKVSNEQVAKLERTEEDDQVLSGLTLGTTTVTATAAGLTREIDVEIQEQVVEEMEWVTTDPPILAVNQEFELAYEAHDANGDMMEFSPEWTLENRIGSLTNAGPNAVTFTATKEGVETVYVEFQGLSISTGIRVAGDKKTVVTSTTGQGTISILPQQDVYDVGEPIELQAVPAEGWTFVRWNGDIQGTNPKQTITIESHLSIGAVFESEQQHMYALSISKIGKGTILKSSLSNSFQPGEIITLTARPEDGYEFDRWTGAVESTSPSITFTIESDQTIRVIFKEKEKRTVEKTHPAPATPKPPTTEATTKKPDQTQPVQPTKPDPTSYTLSTSHQGEGSIIRSEQNSQYDAGTTLTIRAQASEGWRFIRWEGNATGSSNPLSVTMNGSKSITAVFERIPEPTYTLSLGTEGQGSIRTTPSVSEFKAGTVVILTAIPGNGWRFAGWSGANTSSNTSISIQMNSDISLQAKFEEVSTE